MLFVKARQQCIKDKPSGRKRHSWRGIDLSAFAPVLTENLI
jgi:hypothetical protein